MSTRDQAPAERARVQRWLQAAISDPCSTPGASAEPAASMVTRSARMDAAQRVGVYRDAYQARLLECLADDYPALRALLGRADFAALARRYSAAQPPRSASLNGYGAELAPFCMRDAAREALAASARSAGCTAALLHDLARLEWAQVELIHAPGAVPLARGELLARQHDFAALRLVAVPAVRLLQLDHRVHALWAALRRAAAGASAALPVAERAPSFVLVHRRGWDVRCAELPADEGAVLARVLAAVAISARGASSSVALRGASLGAALVGAAAQQAERDQRDAARAVHSEIAPSPLAGLVALGFSACTSMAICE